MKALLVIDPDWMPFQGGDSIAWKNTAEALRTLGVDASECHDPFPDATGFDIAHVFNLRTYEATARQIEAIHRSGVPIVMTPFYMATKYGEWAALCLQGLLTHPYSEEERKTHFEGYQARQLTLTMADGTTLSADSANRPAPAYQKIARTILSRIQYLLPNSFLELDRIRKDFQAYNTPFAVIPLGVDAEPFLRADPGPFVQKYGLKDFVLQVSRIEPLKNQLGLVYALRGLEVPVVLIGKPMDPNYVELCRRYGPRHLTILPYLPLKELCGAYAAARVHVLANWTETCGLVSLEASLAGCNLVCSTAGYELEFFRDLVYYCDPIILDSIRQTVAAALAHYDRDAPRRQELRNVILRDYTWQRAAEMTLQVYRRVLGSGFGK